MSRQATHWREASSSSNGECGGKLGSGLQGNLPFQAMVLLSNSKSWQHGLLWSSCGLHGASSKAPARLLQQLWAVILDPICFPWPAQVCC